MSARLRIAIFAESYLPYLSGVTVATDALARGLGAAGHHVLVVAPRPGRAESPGWAGSTGPEPRFAWLPSYQLPRVVPAGYRMPWPLAVAGLRQAVRFRPDIVHAQSPFVAGLLAREVARRAAAPLVFTHHTRFSDYRHYLGPLAGPGAAVTDTYLRGFWAGCAAIVAPSSDLAAEIRARQAPSVTGRPLVRAIPTGIDVDAIAALPATDPRPLAGWPPDAVVVASLGRLAPEKSVDELMGAFAAAEPSGRLRLLLIGTGPAEATLRRRAEAPDLAGRVLFSGQLPRMEALALLRGADLFAFASRTETQGLVLAEALACGLPVAALDGPGVADSVRHGTDGVIVAGRQDQLASAIGALAGDEARRSRMARAARRGAGRFRLAARIEQVTDLYRVVLADRPSSSAAAPR